MPLARSETDYPAAPSGRALTWVNAPPLALAPERCRATSTERERPGACGIERSSCGWDFDGARLCRWSGAL